VGRCRSFIPAIAGVGQVVQRPGDQPPESARGPIELMIEASRRAEDDAEAAGLLTRVGFIGVAGGWFRYRNPAQLIGERIGAPSAASALASISGTGPQDLVALAAQRIAHGELDVALVVGGEARWTHQRLKRQSRTPRWLTELGAGDPEPVSQFPDSMTADFDRFGSATVCYALFEDRLRSAAGASVPEHTELLSSLWSQMSSVAVRNPYAWDRTPKTVAEIARPSVTNRLIASPYTKAMVANNTVDMASAVLVCSSDAAKHFRVPADRLVFPHVITRAHETWRVSERRDLHRLPALEAAAVVAFERIGSSPSDIEHIDLYACFPSIVQMSSHALGIPLSRPISVTGGLGFAGAAVGNSVGHSIAALTDRVRSGGLGLVHGNGGLATKHSVGIYSAEPPDEFVDMDVQESVDLRPRAVLPEEWAGDVTVEAATVVFGRESPSHVIAAVLDESSARGWATASDPVLIEQTLREGIAGFSAIRLSDGSLVVR
jgi:acetyl-CoA C-acetyltransferase